MISFLSVSYRLLFFILVGIQLCRCQLPRDLGSYGLAQGYEAFIPARIAIVSTQWWALRSGATPLRPSAELSQGKIDLTARFDEFILAGFDQQRFMLGVPPALVQQFAAVAGNKNWQQEGMEIWQQALAACAEKEEEKVPRLYRQCIAPFPAWQLWLTRLGKITHNSDALLLPLVLSLEEEEDDARGFLLSSRRGSLGIFLIACDSGELLWSQKAATQVSSKAPIAVLPRGTVLPEKPVYPAYPGWKVIFERLFTPGLWKDFPGRILVPGE